MAACDTFSKVSHSWTLNDLVPIPHKNKQNVFVIDWSHLAIVSLLQFIIRQFESQTQKLTFANVMIMFEFDNVSSKTGPQA